MPKSNFSTDLSGWTTSNATETYAATGGNPGGNLRGIEGGSGVWYFEAPSSYLGDKSAFYGGSISFDQRQDITTSQFDDDDIILTGGGITLALDVGANPGTDWTSYSVSLALGGGWKIGSISGRVATEAEIRTVLGDLQSLEIRGEFVNGAAGDASNLDNVAMTKSPAQPPEFLGPKIKSTFNTDTEGWSFVADVQDFKWVGSGGNPGGYLEAVDFAFGEVWYFVAPDKFLGNKTAYGGGKLQFDLKQSSTTSQFDTEDVIISGGGLTIVLDLATNPGVDWTHYMIGLDTSSDWRMDTLAGAVATQAQIDTVLANVTDLKIRGEYISGDDTGGIDNVIMTASNAPVRVLENATTGGLISSHSTLDAALAVTDPGNLVLINNVSATPLAAYDVNDNGLTVSSNKPLDARLVLKSGTKSITLTGDNDLKVTGNGKNNLITGSDGDNTLTGRGGKDVIDGRGGKDVIKGNAGQDTLSGGGSHDKMTGGDGADVMHGNSGNDRLFGQKGADILWGDKGNDIMSGGGGSDTFQFRDGFGTDTINGFAALDDNEKINLALVTSITDFADLVADHMTQSGSSVVIDDLGGNTITLSNTSLADLDAADFLFV